MSIIDLLQDMRQQGGPAHTTGLADSTVLQFAASNRELVEAIEAAHDAFLRLREEEPELLVMDESAQVREIQKDYINFYADDAINPYVTLSGRGPWIVTLKGAVLYETGGYGMLGLGHAPKEVLEVIKRPHVMANIMTPNLSQKYLADRLRREIGHRRGGCPFERFLCLNSGSESVSMGARLSDINAKIMTDPGGRYAHKTIRMLSLKGGFHGRTDRPAQFSDSTRATYCKHMASFRDRDNLITVEPNDVEQLEQVFSWAEANRVFIESFFLEPVMGEGNPGLAITPEFYAAAREQTRQHGSLMLVDSIQAGLRAHGVLSVIDYPGFESQDAPDMETFSKALNAGQYPLSVLALNGHAASLYRKGVYGNTMTANPRALDVACAVLDALSPQMRQNIQDRGTEFLDKLNALKDEMDGRITAVQGTGLLFSVELDGSRYKSYGSDSIEEYMRHQGINVIHGGANSLRFTPHFRISGAEVDLIIAATRQALLHGPAKATSSAVAA
ncbi:MAG: aminotransferase class III-fold pyridoxal phosphate-dependent enzyme [Xanthomonadales bacterium]|nr:aminotransferase class III-fold pyridoxal phosphate-dependent enzyme [Xanthomonadales bacterium]